MTGCGEYVDALTEIARGVADDAAARAHAAACAACAARLADERAVTEALRRLRAADEARRPSPGAEARLRRAVRDLTSRRRRTALVYAGLAAAALVAALAGAFLARPGAPAREDVRLTVAPDAADFAPLVYGEPFEGADALHLTRVRVPRSALPALGWPGALEDGPPVEAEVLVGQDGIARGIRFVAEERGVRR